MLPAKASNSCPGRLHPAHSEEPIYNCSFRNLKATASLPMFALGSCDGQSASCVKTRIMEPTSLKSMPRLPDRDFTCRGGDLRHRGDRRGILSYAASVGWSGMTTFVTPQDRKALRKTTTSPSVMLRRELLETPEPLSLRRMAFTAREWIRYRVSIRPRTVQSHARGGAQLRRSHGRGRRQAPSDRRPPSIILGQGHLVGPRHPMGGRQRLSIAAPSSCTLRVPISVVRVADDLGSGGWLLSPANEPQSARKGTSSRWRDGSARA
jgi:hypothetical protein